MCYHVCTIPMIIKYENLLLKNENDKIITMYEQSISKYCKNQF